MSTRSVLLAALALALASAACQPPAQEAGPLSEADVAAIHESFQRYDEAVTAGDAESWMTLLTDDVLWMVPNQATLVSKEAVRTRVQPFFDQLDMEHTTTLEEIEGAGVPPPVPPSDRTPCGSPAGPGSTDADKAGAWTS
jgi:hypothetical protein